MKLSSVLLAVLVSEKNAEANWFSNLFGSWGHSKPATVTAPEPVNVPEIARFVDPLPVYDPSPVNQFMPARSHYVAPAQPVIAQPALELIPPPQPVFDRFQQAEPVFEPIQQVQFEPNWLQPALEPVIQQVQPVQEPVVQQVQPATFAVVENSERIQEISAIPEIVEEVQDWVAPIEQQVQQPIVVQQPIAFQQPIQQLIPVQQPIQQLIPVQEPVSIRRPTYQYVIAENPQPVQPSKAAQPVRPIAPARRPTWFQPFPRGIARPQPLQSIRPGPFNWLQLPVVQPPRVVQPRPVIQQLIQQRPIQQFVQPRPFFQPRPIVQPLPDVRPAHPVFQFPYWGNDYKLYPMSPLVNAVSEYKVPCVDKFSACSKYANDCNEPSLRAICERTCQVCHEYTLGDNDDPNLGVAPIIVESVETADPVVSQLGEPVAPVMPPAITEAPITEAPITDAPEGSGDTAPVTPPTITEAPITEAPEASGEIPVEPVEAEVGVPPLLGEVGVPPLIEEMIEM